MKLLEKKYDFEVFESYFKKMLNKKPRLPEKVFKKELEEYAFIPFDDLFQKTLFDIVNQRNNDQIYWAVLEPSPSSYYYRHFGKYNIVKWTAGEESYENFWQVINAAPKDSPADSLVDNSYTICMFSTVGNWCIYGERDTDIAVCAFNTSADRNNFIEGYDEYLISSASDLMQYIESFNNKDRELFKNNYMNRTGFVGG